MKTLHITNAWHATSGGIATFYRALMEAAIHRGHGISLVVPAAEDRIEEIGPHALIYSVASRPAPLNPDYRLLGPGNYLQRGSRLRQILNIERPDLVEVCDKYTLNYFAGMLRAGLMGDVAVKPLVVGLSCERMDSNVRAYIAWNSIAQSVVPFYMKWLYFSLFDHHIANSAYTAEELRLASFGHPIRRGVWIRPMGVDTRDLSPSHRSSAARQSLLERIHGGPESVLLLYVGRFALEKNLELLLQTFESLLPHGDYDWRLILVGDGAERARFVADAAQRVPGRVEWLGHVHDRNELCRIYANCDVFLHPNPSEPFGIAPLEAMASGLPVVVPDRGGVLSYADPANAWLTSPDGCSFARAVRDAVSNPPARAEKIARALLTAAEFSWKRAAGSFIDLYEDLYRGARGDPQRIIADFYSTAPEGKGSTVARITAGLMQRLLATR
jgi:alpha-1,6-mannosyltransferase